MSDEHCNKCKFWSVFPVDLKVEFKRGTCRRMPPVIDPIAVHEEIFNYEINGKQFGDETAHSPTMWSQPGTWQDMWCGEFKKIP